MVFVLKDFCVSSGVRGGGGGGGQTLKWDGQRLLLLQDDCEAQKSMIAPWPLASVSPRFFTYSVYSDFPVSDFACLFLLSPFPPTLNLCFPSEYN